MLTFSKTGRRRRRSMPIRPGNGSPGSVSHRRHRSDRIKVHFRPGAGEVMATPACKSGWLGACCCGGCRRAVGHMDANPAWRSPAASSVMWSLVAEQAAAGCVAAGGSVSSALVWPGTLMQMKLEVVGDGLIRWLPRRIGIDQQMMVAGVSLSEPAGATPMPRRPKCTGIWSERSVHL